MPIVWFMVSLQELCYTPAVFRCAINWCMGEIRDVPKNDDGYDDDVSTKVKDICVGN